MRGRPAVRGGRVQAGGGDHLRPCDHQHSLHRQVPTLRTVGTDQLQRTRGALSGGQVRQNTTEVFRSHVRAAACARE